MNQITDYLKKQVLPNSLWIYLTLFLCISYLLLVTIREDTWGTYLLYPTIFCIVYFPILLFAFFRKKLVEKVSVLPLVIIWIACFLLYPYLVFYNRDLFMETIFPANGFKHGNEDILAFYHSILLTINALLVLTEIGILSNDYVANWIKKSPWLQRIGMEKMLLLLLFAIACLIGVIGTFENGNVEASVLGFIKKSYLVPYYAIQMFVIFLMYYFFYYVNKYVLIPVVLKSQGVIYYGFSIVATILIAYPIFIFFTSFLPIASEGNLLSELYHPMTPSIFGKDRGGMPLLIMLFSVPIIVSLQWFRQSSQIANLEKEKSATELNLLKQQINPHFFFNTLNNLYALSITKNKQTPEVILQLSELMRYVIYKGKEDQVELREEIKYIEDYIQLQQLRLYKKLDFQFEKSIANEQLAIPPLLFITFVENAFKHGIEPAENACFLHLSLHSDEKGLTFTCENSVEPQATKKRGIGLNNLQRRMELRFPNQHEIKIKESTDRFKAVLILNT